MRITRNLLQGALVPVFLLSTLFNSGCSRRFDNPNELRMENVTWDMEAIYDVEDILPECPLTLQDILITVFTYNLDLLTQVHERNVQVQLAMAEQLKMLPPLTLDGIFSSRSQNTASLTRILGGPQPVVQPQIASLRETRQWDVRETLNIMDFGLAYFKSKQECDRAFIIEQQQLRFRQKLVLDTFTSYWKAISAQLAMAEVEEMIVKTVEMNRGLENQIGFRSLSEIQGLHTESHLIDLQIQMYAVEYQLGSAKAELGALMGLPPSVCFELADIELNDKMLEICNIQELEDKALLYRPELAVKDLEEQIARESVRSAILQMFPGVSMFADYNNDSNPFLIFQNWLSAGIRCSWNLFNIPQQWSLKLAAEEQILQSYRARLALSVAVMSQVHIAYLGYKDALIQFRLANQAYDVKRRLAEAAEKERQAGEFNGADSLSFAAEATVARIYALKAYGSLQVSIEQLNYAIGTPLHFGDINIDGTIMAHFAPLSRVYDVELNQVEEDIEVDEDIEIDVCE